MLTTLNCRGRLLNLHQPVVMGILNLTPDSFSDGGLYTSLPQILHRVEQLLTAGATVVDVGGHSTRPGAAKVPPEEEIRRILEPVKAILSHFPEAFISIDTFNSEVARVLLEAGAHIINDVSGGQLDAAMYSTVAAYRAPYVLMHMQGTPQTMQLNPQYGDAVAEVYNYFVERIQLAQAAGLYDLLLDPGFGFGKNLAHNYTLLANLHQYVLLGLPLVVGISKKSMLTQALHLPREQVQPATDALHWQALQAGARMLRVHEVAPAVQLVRLYNTMQHGAF